MKRLIVFLALSIVLMSACQPRVVEFQARMGIEIDGKTGFWAYKTELKPNEPDSVLVLAAEHDWLEGRQEVWTPEKQYVYPIEAYIPGHLFVVPGYVRQALPFETSEIPDSMHTVVLGYFMKNLVRETNKFKYLEEESSEVTKGMKWAIPNTRLEKLIAEEAARLREYAASYGADAITELAVFYQGQSWLYGQPGFYITGRAVAFDFKGTSQSPSASYWDENWNRTR